MCVCSVAWVRVRVTVYVLCQAMETSQRLEKLQRIEQVRSLLDGHNLSSECPITELLCFSESSK